MEAGLKVKHVALEEASLEQLRWFAGVILQLELRGTENTNTLIAIIKRAWHQPNIFLPEKSDEYEPQVDSKGNARPPTKMMNWPEGSAEKRECCRIIIHRQDPQVYPGGDEPVPVGVNGVALRIPRGSPQWVPVEYVEVLEHAERFVYAPYDPEKDPLGGLREPQIVKEYPFSYS